MAFSGVHIACGYVGGAGQTLQVQSLARAPEWSQSMSAAGTTTQSAPKFDLRHGLPAFEVRAAVDIWVSAGATPDAANGPRLFIPANETRNFFCQPGDRLAWIAA